MDRKPQIDGLRFILFTAIFFYHCDFLAHAPLSYGVVFFFILSGFLISRMLDHLGESGLSARAMFSRFYANRAIRILPSYFALVTALALLGLSSSPFRLYSLTYNFKLFSESFEDVQKATLMVSGFLKESVHLWSVCVEAQFYLFFPLVYLFVPAKRRIAALCALYLVGFFSHLYFMNSPFQRLYGALPWVHLDLFAAGAVVFELMKGEERRYFRKRALFAITALFCVLLPWIESVLYLDGPFHQLTPGLMQSAVAVCGSVMIGCLWSAEPDSRLSRWLGHRWLVVGGSISYVAYLIHMLVIFGGRILLRIWAIELKAESFLLFVVTLALSWIIWKVFDAPIQARRRHLA